MVEPTPGTEAIEVLHSPTGTTSPVVSARPFSAGICKLSAGARWHDYRIDGPATGGRVNTFEATHVGRMEKVLISASLLDKTTALRRGIWDQLSTKLSPEAKILACLEMREEEGWRYEVTAPPPPMTLREWIACHQAENSLQRQFLRQMTATLSSLHSLGIVHLNIRPELVYLDGEGESVEVILGGLDQAVLYKQSGRAVGSADLFYAPPEAVNPEGAPVGIALCAWDWWSVGRIVQEMTLGRHVMSMLFGSDVIADPSPQLNERAKSLLLEIEPAGFRAGALEAMTEVGPSVKIMLRGLLTSARDARWGGEALSLWLAKEDVSNHYDLARNARFFTWDGRGRTLSEAAEYFRTEEHWSAGERNIFEPENPETLANFLSTVPVHSADWRKIQDLHTQIDALDIGPLTEATRRALIAGFVWLTFVPPPGALMVKGRRIDVAGLTELLSSGQDSSNYDIVRALMTPACLAMIKPLDATAAETLRELAALGGMALRQAEQHKWVDENDAGNLAYVLKLSLETDLMLRKRAERVRSTYATCQDETLAGMLADKNPAAWVQVLLVVTGENPRRFGYITLVEHARQQGTRVQARSEQLQVALFWLHLKQMLLAGRPWSGTWQTFSISWLLLVVFGVVVAQDIVSTAGLAFALMGLRFVLGWRIWRIVRQCDPTANHPWISRDGPERCEVEAQRVWPETTSLPALEKQLEAMTAEMTSAQPGDHKILSPNYSMRLRGLLPVYGVTALLCIAGSVQLLKNLGQNLGYQALSIAGNDPAVEKPLAKDNRYAENQPDEIATQLQNLPGLDPAMVEKVKAGEYEITKESFGYALNGPIQKWAFSPPAVVPQLPVESRAPATSAQRAFAQVSGELLLRPYGRKGVTALFIVPVPTKTGFGLMIYNAKARTLIDNVAMTVREGLPNNTWYHVDRYNVIYLGAPSQMEKGRAGLLSQR